MERVCPKCGKLVSGDGVFCPECGAQLDNVVDLNAPQSAPAPTPTNSYTQNANPSGYNQIPQYPQSYNNAPAEEPQEKMSVGSRVGTVKLTSWFGIISIILLFVWAFGNTPQPKKNYCRAMLIFQLIALILVVVLFVVFMAIIGWNFDAFTRAVTEFGVNFRSTKNFNFRVTYS